MAKKVTPIETAKRGRRPLSEDVRRTERITVPLNKQELAIIKEAISKTGSSMPDSQWARDVLLAAAQKGSR